MATDWKAVRKRARQHFNRLKEHYHGHNSHIATEALELAAKEFGVGYGVEGFCTATGGAGVTYINMGDTYDTTVVFESDTETFSVGCYGDIIERAPDGTYE